MIHTPLFPLAFDDSYGFADASTTKQVVHFHLKNLLLTNPGEKISDHSYGVGIRKYLFEQSTPGVLNLISDKILQAINIYLNYLSSVTVRVESSPEGNKVMISIKYGIPNLINNDVFVLDVRTNFNY